eukprot:1158139-Pelagomonas_calceolata.AAC.6
MLVGGRDGGTPRMSAQHDPTLSIFPEKQNRQPNMETGVLSLVHRTCTLNAEYSAYCLRAERRCTAQFITLSFQLSQALATAA